MNLNYFSNHLSLNKDKSGWSPLGSMHFPRASHSATGLKSGNILVAGGTTGLGVFASPTAEVYDQTSREWVQVSNMNVGRSEFSLVSSHKNGVLAIGGFASKTDTHSSAELYDENKNTWTLAAEMNQKRHTFSSVELSNGDIMVFGGAVREGDIDTSLATTECYSFDTNRWKPTAMMSTPRAAFTATRLKDGKILVAGGVNENVSFGGQSLASAELYDPATDVWQPVPDMHHKRVAACAALLKDGRVLVMGGAYEKDGQTGVHPLSACEIYDPETRHWESIAPMSMPRMLFMSTLMASGDVIAVGGLQDAVTVLNEGEYYNSEKNIWTRTDNLLVSRAFSPVVTTLSGSVVLCGGLSGTVLNATPTCEAFCGV